MKLPLINLLLPPSLTSHSTPTTRSTPSYWTCTPSPTPTPLAPGLPTLAAITDIFTALYGPEPIPLRAEQARLATCNGLPFGLWNGHPYTVPEPEGLRVEVARRDPEDGRECLGHADEETGVDDDLRLSYMFGFAEDSWVSGGLTEIRRCEDY
ncbi:hypothetical protein CKAH01_16587 [Colletotrichum kahawae]|uniref:Uncharacterized protein n=1 Tax=Colletotrichum kahawae TaxID=34407 RepID=A0AAE0D6K7_COLKA|nr:hypothetical protein CKAH01_16587 [Colletotrichum kahawae]